MADTIVPDPVATDPVATDTGRRFGMVAVLGAPNAGKSTLVNRLVGAQVSIVTHKIQTTRIRILGIAIRNTSQIAFIDTPGIFEPRRRFERSMVDASWRGAADADLAMLMVDAKRGIDDNVGRIVAGLKKTGFAKDGRKAVLALNKIDTVDRETLLGLASRLDGESVFSETFMISALKGDGVDDLFGFLEHSVLPGEWLYPEDQMSDLPQRLLAAEITREKLLTMVHQEIPYAATVETDEWEESGAGGIRISQTVYVRQNSQKAIVLGKGGRKIKELGTAARKDMTRLFDRPVHLFLRVKVHKRWMEDPARYAAWGLRFNA